MEHQDNRVKLYQAMPEMVNSLTLDSRMTKALLELLSESLNKTTIDVIMNYPDDLKKSFILLELTKTRISCDEIIDVLKQSADKNNQAIGETLAKINTPPSRVRFSGQVYVPVNRIEDGSAVQIDPNQVYPMTKNPRGHAIIINNLPKLVQRDAQRFWHIFTQLYFTTEIWQNLTAVEITQRLRKVKDKINQEHQQKGIEPQGLIVMVTSHGQDDAVYGRKACRAMEDLCEHNIVDNNPNSAINMALKSDLVTFDDIKGVFSKRNFTFEANFPRMFFFSCCGEGDYEPVYSSEMLLDFKTVSESDCDTYMVSSCSKGYENYVDPEHHYTFFGKMLGESIAQYAVNKNLTEIISMTRDALREWYWQQNGHIAKEWAVHGLKRSIYFNPGYISKK